MVFVFVLALVAAACGSDLDVSAPGDDSESAATPDPQDQGRAEAALITAADLGGTWADVPVAESDPADDQLASEVFQELPECEQAVAADPDPSDGLGLLDFGPEAPVRVDREFEDAANNLSYSVLVWPTVEEAGLFDAIADLGLADCFEAYFPEFLRRAAIEDPEAPDFDIGEVTFTERPLNVGDESAAADLVMRFEVQGLPGTIEITFMALRVDRMVVLLQFGDFVGTSTLDPGEIARLAGDRAREAMAG